MRMKTFVLASSAAAGLALSAGAASAEPNGWYGAIDAGYHMIDDINAESSTTGANWNYEVNDSWAAFARLGYRFNPNWRVELEGGYRSGDIGRIRAVSGTQGLCNATPATGGCFSPSGDIVSYTAMANVIYDFGYEAWGIRPFVGLGAGANQVRTTAIGRLRANRGAALSIDDNSTKFAAQAIAGLAWAVTDRANIDLTYRYLTGDASWDSTTLGTGAGATQFGEWDGDYDQSHTVTLGLRYSFGAEEMAPPPPPPPPPPPSEPEPAIEVIAVDVDPPRRRKRSPKRRSRSRSHSTHEREIYVERERLVPVRVPVPVPVRVEPKYDTYRYVEGPSRRYIEPPPPQRKMITEHEHQHIHINDRHREHEYYRR